jgi:predicted nucleic acid-binding Zn ribbon protein
VEPLGAVMPSAVRHILRQGAMSPGKLAFAWRLAVGAAIARASEVSLREDGTVDVLAVDPAWRRELKRSHDLVLTRLQDLLGSEIVRRVRVLGRPGRV